MYYYKNDKYYRVSIFIHEFTNKPKILNLLHLHTQEPYVISLLLSSLCSSRHDKVTGVFVEMVKRENTPKSLASLPFSPYFLLSCSSSGPSPKRPWRPLRGPPDRYDYDVIHPMSIAVYLRSNKKMSVCQISINLLISYLMYVSVNQSVI